MTDYDFRALNDKEFEVLATDLLSKRDGDKYERFKPGRDAGVDGRFFRPNGTEVILQCKHWPSSPLERLIRHLEDVELPKIKKLKPATYVLAISHPLSRHEKTRILSALRPYISTPANILGREDLNDLLSQYQEVELRHYKLWISSTNVLRHLLNKPILDRSLFALQEIRESAHLYVPTENHDRALAKLEELGTVIITGPAGIGKTTLADHLTLNYVTKGFEFIRIAEDIHEAEAAFQADALQLFYFDDFLGRNYLEALTGHEGTHIVHFIRRIARDKKKRFILTSRTTIMNQGKVLIDVFLNHNLERNEFEVSFESFSEIDKARILYNHMWHSSLEPQYVEELYTDRRYRQIIAHRNYNPRLVRYITDSDRLTNCTPALYWPYVKDLFDNPAKVWENPFEAQHDDFGRALILLVTLNARPITQSELSESYARFIAHADAKAMHGRRDYLQSLRHLAGSMLSRTVTGEREPLINLFNPSIGDFVLRRYASDVPSLRAGFSSLRSTSSLRTLFDLERNNLISTQVKKTVLDTILDGARASGYVGYSSEYIALALVNYATKLADLSPTDERIAPAARFVAEAECPGFFADVAEVLEWRFSQGLSTQQEVAEFVTAACEIGANSHELERLSNLVHNLTDEQASELWPSVEELAVNYFTDAVHDEFSDDDVFFDVDPESSYQAEKNLSQLIEAKLVDLGVKYSDSTVESIVEAFDISERMRGYFQSEPDYDYREGRTFANPQMDAIDDLFDRSR
ncbi:MAG: nSTAND3 domain-containing NTPase [Halomonadaceae bacterium]|jgi:adenylate kinase family enzyme